MEPRSSRTRLRARALTVAAVALTAAFTLGTTLLPSSAHAAELRRSTTTAATTPSPQGLISLPQWTGSARR